MAELSFDNLSADELRAILAVREAKIKELEAKKAGIRSFELAVSDKGRIIVHNLTTEKRGAPYQFWKEELEALLSHCDDIKKFIAENSTKLVRKEDTNASSDTQASI